MGNILDKHADVIDEDDEKSFDDELIKLKLNSVFNTAYLTSVFVKLPIYTSTEVSFDKIDEKTLTSWNPETWYLKNLFCQFKDDVHVNDFEVILYFIMN